MPPRLEELAKTIDGHLAPEAKEAGLARLCDEACASHFAAVCVPPGQVGGAAERLRGCDVKVAAELLQASTEQARRCVSAGAVELDVLLDTEAMLAGEFRAARARLSALVHAAGMAGVNTGRGQVLVKVVVDGDRLDGPRKQLACRILDDVGADFGVLRTSAPAGTSALWDAELLRERLPERIGVKVAGPVASVEEAQNLIAAGVGRIGTPYAAAVLGGLPVLRRAS
jgi:deoxyribose-phosphate aldolase